MSNDIYTVATVFETKGQEAAEKALRDNEAAVKAYEKAQQTLNSRMKISIDSSNKKAKTLGQLDAATKKAENEIKRLAVSIEQGAITGGQYQGRLNQISAALKTLGLENAQSKVMSYGRAVRESTATVKQHEAALKAKAVAQGSAVTSTQRLTQATLQGRTASQAIREQFLGTANAIAVLDGPLGGVASRFSAFGVLAGRAGVGLAVFGVAFTTFSFVAQRSIRDLADWEVQVRTIENRLNTLGNQVALTSQEIVRMSEDIGLSTLADEREVINAAGQLLTFRKIGTDVFEDVLRSAQDLAASGFGTLESETIKLAKALEDPRQSLTALSRAGVVFSRQQRQVITDMVDSGREAEAMALILQNVEKQVGGAGLAQANGTLAGSFDTIGQSVRTASKDFGEFVADTLKVRSIIDALAVSGAKYIESTRELTLAEKVTEAKDALIELNTQLENSVERSGILSTAFLGGGQRIRETVEASIVAQQEVIRNLEEQLRLEEAIQGIGASENVLARREEALTNIQQQIDLQRELVGLTQEEERVRRALAAEGLAGNAWQNINAELANYRQSLMAAGVDIGVVNALVEKHRSSLEGIRNVAQEYAQAFRDQSIAREINRIGESTQQTNEALRIQVRILEEARAAGDNALTVTDARRRADLEIQIQMIETQRQTYAAAEAAAVLAGDFDAAAEAAANVARMAALINSLNEGIELQAQVATLGRPTRSSGGGGGGGGSRGPDPNEEYQRELESLQSYLEKRREEMLIASGFEAQVITEQYDERFQHLQSALERQLVTRQEYDDLFVKLTQSREDKISAIESASNAQRLGDMAGFFGSLAGVASAGGDGLVKAVAAFRGVEAIINAWSAYTQVLADPAFLGRPWARVGAAVSVLGAGLNAARSIASAGGGSAGSAGSAGGGASGRVANAPREAREASPQRVLVQGLDPRALYSGEQLQALFEAFQSENNNRGQVFVVSR